MSCCSDYYAPLPDGERGFEIAPTRVRFGRGLLDETGDAARECGMTRVALFTDSAVRQLPFFETVRQSLRMARVDFEIYDDVAIEPADTSFAAAAAFAAASTFDGYISVGGGSTIDTAKAANLYATYPADFLDYVNAPIGNGRAVPGPLKPHIACPTTSGSGSECTGIAIFDLLARGVKTGIASPRLKPTLGIVDPDVTRSLPSAVVACSGFDVLSHALESYTALPYSQRKRPGTGEARPLSQGANPFSDMACVQALEIIGRCIERAVHDGADDAAREGMMFAAMLAGIGFGSAGCHVPHAMSYAVSGLVKTFCASGYPREKPIVPHGMSVIVNAPAVFEFTAPRCPARHLDAARRLGYAGSDVDERDAGKVLSRRIVDLMRSCAIPLGLSALDYSLADLDALVEGSFAQRRLLANSPREVGRDDLRGLFGAAMRYA